VVGCGENQVGAFVIEIFRAKFFLRGFRSVIFRWVGADLVWLRHNLFSFRWLSWGLEQAERWRFRRGEKRAWNDGGYLLQWHIVRFGFGVTSAIAVENLFAGDGGDAVAGDDDAGEVHGVGGGDPDDSGAVAGAGGAERFHGFGQGVLLANEAGDEAASANLAASFEAAEDVEKIAPFRSVGFAGEEIAEENAVAREELTGEGFEGGIGAAGLLDDGRCDMEFFGEKRPAASGAARGTSAGSFGGRGFAARIHAGAELVEAVGCGEACGG
jgi:hypothetical protein